MKVSKNKKNVYILSRSTHDYSPAKVFGNIKYLSSGPLGRYNVTNMARLFTEVLKHSNPDDYILITGMTVMSCIACAIFVAKHGRLNLLLFRADPGNHHYIERTVIFEDEEGTLV
jgi:hypothetical protein